MHFGEFVDRHNSHFSVAIAGSRVLCISQSRPLARIVLQISQNKMKYSLWDKFPLASDAASFSISFLISSSLSRLRVFPRIFLL